MSEKRRFNEKEIAAIFEQASQEQEAVHQNHPGRQGLDLSELQKIGEEAGISPEFIARAAKALVSGDTGFQEESLFGIPVQVSKKVSLPRKMTDDEWEQLVVDLRDVFQGEGQIKQEGSFREWKYREIAVYVEPSNAGHRVRMETTPNQKGATAFGLGFFVVIFLISLIFWYQVFFDSGFIAKLVAPGSVFLLASLVPIISFAFMPRWARKSREKMKQVATRLSERLEGQRQNETASDRTISSPETINETAGDDKRLNLKDADSDSDTDEATQQRTRLRS